MNYRPYNPNSFSSLPTVTKYIIIISVALFVLKSILKQSGIDLDDILGLHYFKATKFKPHQFITYIFMHADIMHLVFNMLGLFVFGRVLEEFAGSKKYLNFYLLTGVAAAIAQLIIMHLKYTPFINEINQILESTNQNQAQYYDYLSQKEVILNSGLIIGASGSVFGLLGAFAMLFPNQPLSFMFLPPIKAVWLVTIYGLIEFFLGLVNVKGDNIAHFAHLGGLIVGVFIAYLWKKRIV
ncbi:MAG: rhomboid family intramembrane serine protease [Bacteroidia bacterium]|nr:rhomboid family intramembrane serine protease [Bacteroidia bacterium]